MPAPARGSCTVGDVGRPVVFPRGRPHDDRRGSGVADARPGRRVQDPGADTSPGVESPQGSDLRRGEGRAIRPPRFGCLRPGPRSGTGAPRPIVRPIAGGSGILSGDLQCPGLGGRRVPTPLADLAGLQRGDHRRLLSGVLLRIPEASLCLGRGHALRGECGRASGVRPSGHGLGDPGGNPLPESQVRSVGAVRPRHGLEGPSVLAGEDQDPSRGRAPWSCCVDRSSPPISRHGPPALQ